MGCIPPAPVPQIDATFGSDANNVLSASPQSQSAGNLSQTAITHEKNGLLQAEIGRMAQESERYRAHDAANETKSEEDHDWEKRSFATR